MNTDKTGLPVVLVTDAALDDPLRVSDVEELFEAGANLVLFAYDPDFEIPTIDAEFITVIRNLNPDQSPKEFYFRADDAIRHGSNMIPVLSVVANTELLRFPHSWWIT